MEFKQGTIAEIVDSERLMVLAAATRYGGYYEHAIEASLFLSTFLKSIDHDRFMFARFLSQVKKHHTLALFSTVRLHQIQATMNLRQVLEAGAGAAYAIANPDPADFVAVDDRGLLNQLPDFAKKVYRWLDKHHPASSESIKDMKSLINESTAHANIVYTENNFVMDEANGYFGAPFFDREDEYLVKTDLWRIGNIAVGLLDLFWGVNLERNVIKFADDFLGRFGRLVEHSKTLHTEMTSTERYKRAMETAQQRKEKTTP